MALAASVAYRCSPRILLAVSFACIIMTFARAQFPDTDVPGSAEGTILALTSPLHGDAVELRYYLRNDSGAIISLQFCSGIPEEDITVNAHATVQYSHVADGVMYSCQAPIHQQSRRLLFGDTIDVPTKPTFLVYIVTMCGYNQPAAATDKDITNLFTGDALPLKRNMAGYYNTCSYGQVTVNPSQVKIMPPVEIPCSARLNLTFTVGKNNDFTSTSCENDNLLKWHYYLDGLAAKQGVIPTDYHHKIMVLPHDLTNTLQGCNGFAGLASSGRWFRTFSANNTWGTGIMWIAGNIAKDGLEMWFHELGHNMGMAHANIVGGCDLYDQCDNTCAMGATGGQGIRCLNAPHIWQLGWGQPFLQMRDEDLTYGLPRSVTVPPQMSSSNSFAMVTLKGMPDNQRIFVSVRVNVYPYDLPYLSYSNGRPFMSFHTYNGTKYDTYRTTVLLGNIALGRNFSHSVSGLVIRFDGWDPIKGANATFCRSNGAKEKTCGDGLDDDCDFLPDHLDPDCAGRMNSPPASDTATQSLPSIRWPPFMRQPPPTPRPLPPPRPSPPSPSGPPSPRPSALPSPVPSPPLRSPPRPPPLRRSPPSPAPPRPPPRSPPSPSPVRSPPQPPRKPREPRPPSSPRPPRPPPSPPRPPRSPSAPPLRPTASQVPSRRLRPLN